MLLDKQSYSRQNIFVFICLLALSIAVRLPFFFPSVINWDESTYILMGQSILDGHLPYTELWIGAPPLTFVFFASAIALFGKSIVSVRIAGTLCVALTAFFTYIIGRTLWNHRSGIVAATLFIALASFLPSCQAVMTEHIALLPLVGALCLMVIRRPTPGTLFLAGVLIAIAACVRLNLAYVDVIVGFASVFIAFKEPPRSISFALKCGLAYAAGNCLIIMLIYLPYAFTNNQQLLWSSVILAPLSYANSQLSFLGTFREQRNYMWGTLSGIKEALFGVSLLVWAGGLAGLSAIIFQWRNTSFTKRRGLVLLMVFLVGTEISILKGGAAYAHYYLQLVPFMALAAASIYFFLSAYGRHLVTGAVLLALAILVHSIIPDYEKIVSRVVAGQPITYGAAYEIAAYLKHENVLDEPIYMMTDHIVYWLINKKPLSKSSTHPSNIAKEYLLNVLVGQGTSTENELSRILAVMPRFIVTKKDIRYLRDKTTARCLLEDTLRKKYELVKEIQGEQIYRRKVDHLFETRLVGGDANNCG